MSALCNVGEKSTENNMEAVQKGCAGPPLHLQKNLRLCKKITKNICVSIDVKQHLDEMKGSVSSSEFIWVSHGCDKQNSRMATEHANWKIQGTASWQMGKG